MRVLFLKVLRIADSVWELPDLGPTSQKQPDSNILVKFVETGSGSLSQLIIENLFSLLLLVVYEELLIARLINYFYGKTLTVHIHHYFFFL